MNESFYISEKNKTLKEILEGFLDTKFFGIIYGKPLTGKTYFIKNFLDSNFINYYYINLTNQNLSEELSHLTVDDYTILIIDNAELLTEKDFEKILYLYNDYRNLSIILIGGERLKDNIIKGFLKKYINIFNFILEWKELDFKEFKEFLKKYMSEKGISITFTNGALKDFYKKSEGKIGKIIYLLYKYKGKKFVYKVNKFLILSSTTVILSTAFLYFFIKDKTESVNNEIHEPNQKVKVKEISMNKPEKLNYTYLYDEKNKECYNFLSYIDLLSLDKEKSSVSYEEKKTNEKKKILYLVYLGVFKNKDNARRLYKMIYEKYSFKPNIIKNKKGYYVVRLELENKDKAKLALNLIKKDLKNIFLVKRLKNE